MKKLNLFFVGTCIAFLFIFFGCNKENEPSEPSSNILPGSFKVDIPAALTYQEQGGNKMSYKTAEGDTLQGNDIYKHLTTFIAVGEGAADIVEDIIKAITVHNINKAMSLSFKSDEDGRTKNAVVVEKTSYEGLNWEFQLTLTDASSEGNPDGGKALQVFWNRKPIKGIAILKPYNINRNDDINSDFVARIDYSEAGELGYQSHMIVSVTGLPLADPSIDPYSVSTLKMFAGKSGDIVDVYGNTNHPNAKFFTNDVGFNWAFVASGKEDDDIGVAEVGLPPSTLNSLSRDTLLGYYSLKEVFKRAIEQAYPGADTNTVNAYLKNTDAPGYFGSDGFISSGTSPDTKYNVIESRLSGLIPYNPYEISKLTVSFK